MKPGDLVQIKRKHPRDQYGDLNVWNLLDLKEGESNGTCGRFPANEWGIFVSRITKKSGIVYAQVIVNGIIGWIGEEIIEGVNETG